MGQRMPVLFLQTHRQSRPSPGYSSSGGLVVGQRMPVPAVVSVPAGSRDRALDSSSSRKLLAPRGLRGEMPSDVTRASQEQEP